MGDAIDRSGWGPGPWDGEPDVAFWRSAAGGLPAAAIRSGLGAWCGYVAVREGHPLHGKARIRLRVHGGVTWARSNLPGDESPPEVFGEGEQLWWIGFDCDHAFSDVSPAFGPAVRALVARLSERIAVHGAVVPGHEYRDLVFVRAQCERMAGQLVEVAEKEAVAEVLRTRRSS